MLESPTGHRWPTVAATLVSVGGLAVAAMGLFLKFVNADVVLYALMSTQRLTFYYWGQDRLANIVPALASPVHNLWLNFYLQMLVQGCAFFGLIGLFVAEHVKSSTRSARSPSIMCIPLALSIASAAGAIALKPLTSFQFVFGQQYALSMLCFLVGAALLVRGRGFISGITGFLSVFVALLIIPSNALLVIIAWPLSSGHHRPWRRVARCSVTVGVAYVGASLCSRLFYDGPDSSSLYNDFSIRRALSGVGTATDQITSSVHPLATVVLLALSIVILCMRRAQLSRRSRSVLVGSWLFGVAWVLVFTGNKWVELNGYSYRYYFPLYAAGLYLFALASTEAVRAALSRRPSTFVEQTSKPLRTAGVGRQLVLIGGIASALALWGVIRMRSDAGLPVLVQARPSADAAHLFAADFVVGDYWRVWPIVFSGDSSGHPLFGVTLRAEAMRHEVSAAIATMEGEHEQVKLMCVGSTPDDCVGAFGGLTARPWLITGVLNDDPLIVAVAPATPS